jgi:hypothetical protein
MNIDLKNPFLILAITSKNYYENGKLQKKRIIAGMKLIFVFNCNPYLFYIKTGVNNDVTIQTILHTDFLKTVYNIVVNCEDKSILRIKT